MKLKRGLSLSLITFLLVALLATALPMPQPVMADHFSPGDHVRIINVGVPSDPPPRGLLVLDSPCGSSIDSVFDGDTGTILEGPEFCAEHYRYKVDWDGATQTGWAAAHGSTGTFMEKIGTSISASSVPRNLRVTDVGDGYVDLSWDPPADNGGSAITGYKLYRSTSSATRSFYTDISADWTTFHNTNVSNGTTYYYWVTAVNAAGESDWSKRVSATPQAAATAPSAPRNLRVTDVGNGYVKLAWDVPSSDGDSPITGYRLYRGTSSGGESFYDATTEDWTTYNNTNVTNGTTYYYKVTAVNAVGESDFSTEVNAMPKPQDLIPGKDVPEKAPDFFKDVLNQVNIPVSDFALKALKIWTEDYENTKAYWNPLATTWDMEEKSWDFNAAGVQNYIDKETGIQATTKTLDLNYYDAIREMLAKQSFDEQRIREGVATWSGLSPNDPYVVNLVSEWEQLYQPQPNHPPVAEAAVSTGQSGPYYGYENPLTVVRGESVSLYFFADKDVNGDGKATLDPDGWDHAENGVSSGGNCKWNADLNQGPSTFEETIANPASPSACNIGPYSYTFNDQPGIYEYQLLKITDAKGAESNVSKVRIRVKEPNIIPSEPNQTGLITFGDSFPVHKVDNYWVAELTVKNNSDLWLEFIPVPCEWVQNIDCIGNDAQKGIFKNKERLIPPGEQITYEVKFHNNGDKFRIFASFGMKSFSIDTINRLSFLPGAGEFSDLINKAEQYWGNESLKGTLDHISKEEYLAASWDFKNFIFEVVKKEGLDWSLDRIFGVFRSIWGELNSLADKIVYVIQTSLGANPPICIFEMQGIQGTPTVRVPSVLTHHASNINTHSATLNGYLGNTGEGTCKVWFKYGKSKDYEFTTEKISRSETSAFEQSLPDLESDTVYHFKAYASNSQGETHGVDKTFKTLSESQAPTASATDITDQPQTMKPDTTYSVTAKYRDPDERNDLKFCYLRLKHPDKPITMMWHEPGDWYSPWAGEEGANYLTIEDVISSEISSGYQLTWKFKLNGNWPETSQSIDFGVFAWDDSDKQSGWAYDDTKASFIKVSKTLESISSKPSEVSLVAGKTQQLAITATYSDGSTADVTNEASYTSSDTSVATVSDGGLITAKSEGEITITVSYTEAGATKNAIIPLTVILPSSEQPQLKAPWEGVAEVSQGNHGPSHKDYGSWDNTYAIDVALPVGTDILAPADGEVVYVDNDPSGSGGKELAIKHKGPTGKEFIIVYLHLNNIIVKSGAAVKQGQIVAKSGATGDVTGPHLHFHMWSGVGSYDSHTIPIERLVMKQVGVDNDFREYDARKGELDHDKIAGKEFESNNTALDTTPPAAVTDLTVAEAMTNSVTLNWKAPGDDGNEGTASKYDIRYSTSKITDEATDEEKEAWWDSATRCEGEPKPESAGSPQSFTVSGLSPGKTYYFALKAADEVPNWSGLSNIVQGAVSVAKEGILVKVINQEGKPAADAWVVAYSKAKQVHRHWTGRTNDNGVVKLDVPEGTYTLVASSSEDHFLVARKEVKAPSSVTIDTQGTVKVGFVCNDLEGQPLNASITLFPFEWSTCHHVGSTVEDGELIVDVTPMTYDGVHAWKYHSRPYYLFKRDISLSQGTLVKFKASKMSAGKVKVNCHDFARGTFVPFAEGYSCAPNLEIKNTQNIILSSGTYDIGYNLYETDEQGKEWRYWCKKGSEETITEGETSEFDVGGQFTASTSTDKPNYSPGETVRTSNNLTDSFGNEVHKIRIDQDNEVQPKITVKGPNGELIVDESTSFWSVRNYEFELPSDAPEGKYTVIFSWDTGPHQGIVKATSHFYVGEVTNGSPNKPNNISPANEKKGVKLTPTLKSSPFSDPDDGDTHAASRWQIREKGGNYSNPVFDSGRDTDNLTSITIPSKTLSQNTTYYWRVRYQDNHNAWSEWSEETSFTTEVATQKRILFDLSHVEQFSFWYGYSELSEELRKERYTLYQLGLTQDDDIEITNALLSRFDVLVLPNPQVSGGYFTQSEISSITSFVQNGGGLLVLGGTHPVSDGQYPVKGLINKFGIGYEIPIIELDGHVTDLREHPIMGGIGALDLAIHPEALKIVSDSAYSIAYSNDKPVIAVSEYEQGRVAVISGEHSFSDIIRREDNLKMALNLFQWLSENSPAHEKDLPKARIINWNPLTNMKSGEKYEVDIKVKNTGANEIDATVAIPDSWIFDESGHGIGEFFYGDSSDVHIDPLATKEVSLAVKAINVGYTYIKSYVYTQIENKNLLMDGVYTERVEISGIKASRYDHNGDGKVRGDVDDLRMQYNAYQGFKKGSEYDHNGNGVIRGDLENLRMQYNKYQGF